MVLVIGACGGRAVDIGGIDDRILMIEAVTTMVKQTTKMRVRSRGFSGVPRDTGDAGGTGSSGWRGCSDSDARMLTGGAARGVFCSDETG